MTLPPLSTCLIAAGLLGLSTALVQKARQPALFGKSLLVGLIVVGALLFGSGLVMHLKSPVPPPTVKAVQPVTPAAGRWSFSFEPKAVRWGEEVRLQTKPETEELTVYFNDRPLPKRAMEKGTVAVTIPAGSKSGYFTLDVHGTRVESREQLTVNK